MIEKLNLFLEALLKYWPILLVAGGWLLAQKRAYEKRIKDREKRELESAEKQKALDEKHQAMITDFNTKHLNLLNSINSVGKKFDLLQEKVRDDHTEQLMRQVQISGDIREVKGKLEGIMIFLPPSHKSAGNA
jgi:hypothetical protein